jgi:diguanylate cyclase (GGDEF)-like protein/putative nucleotidyltransferase with HDIG domain
MGWLKRAVAYAAIDPIERSLAGRLSGVLYSAGGLTLWTFLVLPGVTHSHPVWIIGCSVIALVWGLLSVFVFDWDRAPTWLIHVSALAGLVVIGIEVASSGGARSPGWIYLFFVVVFASYFYPRPVAALYIAGSILTQALPLIYDDHTSRTALLSRLVVGGSTYLVLGGTIASGRGLMSRVRARAELLAAEQGALRRVATAVIEGQPPEALFELVAREAASLLGGGGAAILRLDSDRWATVVGSWADADVGRYVPGAKVEMPPDSNLARARASSSPVRVDEHPPDSPVGSLGYRASIVAPVEVAGRTWGAVAVVASKPGALTVADERKLMEFGALLGSAIASIDDRATLAAQASTDPLTGLANRRALHERLAAEVARGLRHGHIMSVALLDIDHFKEVNDLGGHVAGDDMLVKVAECLTGEARAGDILGRFGGDEFAWVMPETTREQALVAVERARQVIALTSPRSHPVTVSAGICDTEATSHPAELLSHADSALYRSKLNGRDRACLYNPELSTDLPSASPEKGSETNRALAALRALARAVDAKDPVRRGHSERVAVLAGKLARQCGWGDEPSLLLREAALVHDVGKAGLPDGLLTRRDALTEAERDLVSGHVEVSVRMVDEVLPSEAVEWIRAHHERPDGRGYPRGLCDGEIPHGAALLALADAWDAMRSGRPYRAAKSPEVALAECTGLIGSQFTQNAVGALIQLHRIGELEDDAERG